MVFVGVLSKLECQDRWRLDYLAYIYEGILTREEIGRAMEEGRQRAGKEVS